MAVLGKLRRRCITLSDFVKPDISSEAEHGRGVLEAARNIGPHERLGGIPSTMSWSLLAHSG